MEELTTGVSWLAVIFGAVISFLAGWLWYSPKLFGPKGADTVLAYSGGLFAKKSGYARNVDAGYWIVCLVIMIVCQGVFRSL